MLKVKILFLKGKFTMGIMTKLFGTRSEREVKKLIPVVDRIEAMADEYKKLYDLTFAR